MADSQGVMGVDMEVVTVVATDREATVVGK